MTHPSSTKRIFGYDVLKALAAFFVVLYHVGMVDFGYHDGEYYYPTITQWLWLFCACGVPLFFMVNGALTVHRHYDLKKTCLKATRLIAIGVFWGFVIALLWAYRNHGFSAFTPSDLFYYWFLFTLAMLYAISYVLDHLPRWCRWVVVSALLICPFATNLMWDIIILRDPSVARPAWGHFGLFTLYGVVYLYAGDYLNSHRCNRWIALICGVVGLALLGLEATADVNYIHHQFEGGNTCFPTLGALLLSIALFVALQRCDTRIAWLRRYITFLGNNALGIYIFHLVVMTILGIWRPREIITVHPILAVGYAILLTTLSAALSELIRHSPLKFLLKL